MNWRHTATLQLSAIMIIVCFHLHISYAGVEVQTVTPDNSSVEHTVEGPREVPEIVTEPTQFDNGRYRRSAVPSSDRWPNAEIPFEFAPSVKHNLRTRVRKAMRIWQKYTCVQFRHKRHNDKKWVRIQYGGCYSMVGMAAPAQALVLGPNCDKIRSILHELGHCMGLNHEHSRPDRDYYITVYRHRINGYHNFEKLSRDKAFTFGIPYDYYSIMHYHSRNFANSYEDNIVTKDKRMMSVIGRYENLSFYNYKLVYMMYNCGAKCPKKRCPGEGFPAKNCICYCKTNTPKDPIRKCSETECRDLKNTCRQEATNNGCTRNYRYMSENCPKTCGKCPGSNIHYRKETECRDLIFTCRLHAKNNGCTRLYHHMSKSCRKTCGMCSGSNIHHRKETECRDRSNMCSQDARKHGCSRKYPHMSRNCQKTCGRCPGSNIHHRKGPECQQRCSKCWQKLANITCKRKRFYMSRHCKEICRQC